MSQSIEGGIEPKGGYRYDDAETNASHEYLLPKVAQLLDAISPAGAPRRIFDLGCGNGSVAQFLHQKGFEVVGIDVSPEGIQQANARYPHLSLHEGSVYDDLAAKYGTFPVVLSLEVVEHLYAPREYARRLTELMAPGGWAVVSTPYHGYWKNLVMAATGTMDGHFTALWDHGHIKFWSRETLTALLTEAGLEVREFHRVGRIPPLAKSMILVVQKPVSGGSRSAGSGRGQ